MPTDARRRLPARRHGRHCLLELARRARLRLWLGPPRRPLLEESPAPARPHPAGVRHSQSCYPWLSIRAAKPPAASSWSIASRKRLPYTRRTWPGSSASPATSAPPSKTSFSCAILRARAIEAERSRISRDLHDGILQTLLSIEIQLDVLRRRVTTASRPGRIAASASSSRPSETRPPSFATWSPTCAPCASRSADLVDLMRGFAERFRNESTLALDLLIDSAELHAPDRVCREIFQIYREALNNIKKHAKASHVVVKLSQDDSRLVLVVDDNGEGFSFAGRFTGDELDRLRLGPISIKERTRTVGGVLTVESNPGHGARLTIEVPLG